MRRFTLMIAFLFGLAAAPFAAHAQEEDTMSPVSDADSTLPEGADDEAREASKFGLDTAKEARGLRDRDPAEHGRDFGKKTSDGARNPTE